MRSPLTSLSRLNLPYRNLEGTGDPIPRSRIRGEEARRPMADFWRPQAIPACHTLGEGDQWHRNGLFGT